MTTFLLGIVAAIGWLAAYGYRKDAKACRAMWLCCDELRLKATRELDDARRDLIQANASKTKPAHVFIVDPRMGVRH